MTGSDDQDYFARRAKEERARAETAPDSAVASAHLRLAEEYERRMDGADAASIGAAHSALPA